MVDAIDSLIHPLIKTPKTHTPKTGLLVAAICGKVVSANASAVAQAGLPLLLAVVSLHIFGFLFGCLLWGCL